MNPFLRNPHLINITMNIYENFFIECLFGKKIELKGYFCYLLTMGRIDPNVGFVPRAITYLTLKRNEEIGIAIIGNTN